MKWSRPLATALVLAALTTLTCSGLPIRGQAPANQAAFGETPDGPLFAGKPGGTLRLVSPEPQAIVPTYAGDNPAYQITSYLFTGLVKVSFDGQLSPGVATHWESNQDCSLWIFQLRKGSTFHNGEEVTSASFKRGWERAAAKSAGSAVAYLLAPVQGFHELNADGTASELAGVDASDPYSLKVRLAQPDCEFVQRMVQPVFDPVPSSAGPAGNKSYDERPIGNGPFHMDGPWRHNQGLRLVRYDGYTIGAKANLDAVEVTITLDPSRDAYAGFRAGTVDWLQPTLVEEDYWSIYYPQGKVISKRGNGINYLLVMVTMKPLDSSLARKAISLAIDREQLARDVLEHAGAPATSLTPPPFGAAFQAGVCDVCRYDPVEAKRLAKLAGLTPGTALHFIYPDSAGHERWTASVKRQLEATLGLRVNYFGVPFKSQVSKMRDAGASGIFRAAWAADYPSPGDILGPLLSTAEIGTSDPTKPVSGDNFGRYSNPRVDRLLEQAKITKSDAERIDLYRQAERIAIGEDLALIPLWYRQETRLANTDRFTNLRMDWHGNLDLWLVSVK